jgi:hypothetical protein
VDERVGEKNIAGNKLTPPLMGRVFNGFRAKECKREYLASADDT